MDQQIEGIASWGADSRLGPCRGADVAGWIGSRLAPTVDRLEFLLRVVGENKVMVQQMVVPTVQPKVEHDARTGGFVAAAALEACGRLAPEQFSVRPHGIGIGNHRIERNDIRPSPSRLLGRRHHSVSKCAHSRSGPDLDS